MTRQEFMRRLAAAVPGTFYVFAPSTHKRQVVASHAIHIDGREVARAVHRHAKEAK